jgi:hypothetical protein
LLAPVGTALSFCVFRIDRRYHGAVGRSLNKMVPTIMRQAADPQDKGEYLQ